MLISVLVISAVLLTLILGVSETQISTSDHNFNTTSNKYTYYLAESCFEEAAKRLKNDSDFAGETINFEDGNCEITVAGILTKTISITTNFDNYTQNYEAEVSITANGEINNVRLLNWKKI